MNNVQAQNSELGNIFSEFSQRNAGITGAQFLKFCRESKLINSKLFRPDDVDVVFSTFKLPGQRLLDYDGFVAALFDIAERISVTGEELINRILIAPPRSQILSGTAAIPNRFHDDVSTYTGVHKSGGPSVMDSQHRDLSQLLDRNVKSNQDWQLDDSRQKLCNMRLCAGESRPSTASKLATHKRSQQPHQPNFPTSPTRTTYESSPITRESPRGVSSLRPSPRIVSKANSMLPFDSTQVSSPFAQLQRLFYDYSITKSGIDGSKFLKLCQDGKLFDANFRRQDADVIFAKYKENGGRHLDVTGFQLALADIADRKRVDCEQMIHQVIDLAPSPRPSSARLPLPNRFHDDSSAYTGVHKAGGPTIVDRNNITLAQMLNRAPGAPLHNL